MHLSRDPVSDARLVHRTAGTELQPILGVKDGIGERRHGPLTGLGKLGCLRLFTGLSPQVRTSDSFVPTAI